MADYISITDAQVEPLAPVTSELMNQLRDNPIAIAEGATGAPRVSSLAFNCEVRSTGADSGSASGVVVGEVLDFGASREVFYSLESDVTFNVNTDPGTSSWAFQGSVNGSTWTTIVSSSVSAAPVSPFTGNVSTRNLIGSGDTYRYFRLYASGDSDHDFSMTYLRMVVLGAREI